MLRRSIQADIYGEQIRRTVSDEGSSYGAAFLAAACGVHGDVGEAVDVVKGRDEVTEPDPGRVRVYGEYYEVYRSLYPKTKEAMSRLTDLVAGTEGRKTG